ncbi:MAG: polysaccharide deacetylase family protein [Oscillospiraceae bacterium]|nr:polysaccharide deacetylase family protein [Oscillospiraceae bacterium]
MKQRTLLILAVCLLAVFISLVVVAGKSPQGNTPETTEPTYSSEPTSPSTTPTDPSTIPTEPTVGSEATEPSQTTPPTEATEPPVTSEPTEATQPQTKPTQPGGEYIGNLYTRQELEAMENVSKGYGPGIAKNGNRAPYAESNQKAYGKYGGNFIGPDNGCIYLTFDCGYEYQNLTADILDTLKEKNVKAVFFVTMQYVKENPAYVQRMIDEGHVVGNHTNKHPSMPSCSIDRMVSEVMTLHNYMIEHFNYEMTLFRPPTGAFSTRSLAVVQSLGYKNVHWSFAYKDWETANQPNPTEALKTITERHHSGAIYLLHAVSSTNAAVLGDAIDFFIAQGYKLELFQ